jgi:hypothetical protein
MQPIRLLDDFSSRIFGLSEERASQLKPCFGDPVKSPFVVCRMIPHPRLSDGLEN